MTNSNMKTGPGFEELVPEVLLGQRVFAVAYGQHSALNTPDKTYPNTAILSRFVRYHTKWPPCFASVVMNHLE